MKLCMGCMNQMDDNVYTCPHCGFNETNYKQESYYLTPGTIVGGKYIVGVVLSYGGYTISYLGMDAEYNSKVIIKEYLPSEFSTRGEGEKTITIYSGDAQEQFEQGLTNFLNEANRIQLLGNPEGIASVYDCLAENDTGYVITEYLEGHTLKELLDNGKKYSPEEAKEFICQILRGLCKVHPEDIIHCDIAPETIMVTDIGEIKLLDFGATRYVTTANSKSLAIILKQGYAPEEQYRSRGERGPWTDVYALAAVMYRMITGIVPQESVERALVDELKEPSKLGIAIPENMENAMMNGLNVFKEERTPNAKLFLQELNSPTVKRIKVKKRKNDTGKFPVWAKILVACLLCVVIAGGAVLVKITSKNTGSITGEARYTLQDYTGEKIEDVKKNLEEMGYEVVVDEESEFNADENLKGTIARQEPKAEADLEANMPSDWIIENGKVKGVLTCYVYTNEEITYQEIKDLSAYSLSKKLGEDISTSSVFEAVEEGNGDYYDIMHIQMKDGSRILAESLQKEEGKTSIAVNNIEKIYYSANDFFYWDVFDDYVGKNINDKEEMLYEKVNENAAPKQTGETKSLKGTKLIDERFYSFEHDSGYIFEQTVGAGEKIDASEGIEEPILKVVGERLSYSGKTGKQLTQELVEKGFQYVECTGSKDETQGILSVTVYNRDTKAKVTEFAAGDNVRFEIETKVKPKPQPKKSTEKNNKNEKDNVIEPAPTPTPEQKPVGET